MKELKESKCVSCDFKKEKNTDYGKMFQYYVKFENGDDGYVNTKGKEQPFQPGVVDKYNIEVKSITGRDGNPFSWKAISKFREPFNKKDDSRERIKAHANVITKELLTNGLIPWTDEDQKSGIKIEDKIIKTSSFLSNTMLKTLETLGKDNVFIIMSCMDLAMADLKLNDMKRALTLYESLISAI